MFDRFHWNGQLLSVIHAGELDVVNQRFLRPPIADKGRFNAFEH
jgi:hypothetical protein